MDGQFLCMLHCMYCKRRQLIVPHAASRAVRTQRQRHMPMVFGSLETLADCGITCRRRWALLVSLLLVNGLPDA